MLGLIGKFDGAVTHKSLNVDVEASYDQYKFESELTAKTGIQKPGDYEVEFDVCNINIDITCHYNYSLPCYKFKVNMRQYLSHHRYFHPWFSTCDVRVCEWKETQI